MRRPARELEPGLEERHGRVVVDRLGVHRLDEAELVSDSWRVCGSSSLTHAPDLPCCANWKIDGATGKLVCVAVMPVSRWPMRIESGSSCARAIVPAAACSRTGPSATGRRTGTGR